MRKTTLIARDANFLGRMRPIVICILALPLSALIWMSDERFIRADGTDDTIMVYTIAPIMFLVAAYVITIEWVLRALLVLFGGLLLGSALFAAIRLAVTASADLLALEADVGPVLGLAALLIYPVSILQVYRLIMRSRAFGQKCVTCGKRGSIVSNVLDSSFNGQVWRTEAYFEEKRERNSLGAVTITSVRKERVVPYNQYTVHIREGCKNCSDTADRWEQQERKA